MPPERCTKILLCPSRGAGGQPGPAQEGEDMVPGCSMDGAPKPHGTQLHDHEIEPIPGHTSAVRGHRRALPTLPCVCPHAYAHQSGGREETPSTEIRVNPSTLPAAIGSKLHRREEPHLPGFRGGVGVVRFFLHHHNVFGAGSYPWGREPRDFSQSKRPFSLVPRLPKCVNMVPTLSLFPCCDVLPLLPVSLLFLWVY